MSNAGVGPELAAGSEIKGPVRVVSAARVEWYGTGMLTAAAGEFRKVGSNIHTDEEYARSEGLPAVIADGMLTTNWISAMLVAQFGIDYLERGELRTKYIRPVFLGMNISVRAQVISVEQMADKSRVYRLDVWCEAENFGKVTIGDAKVTTVPA